MTVTGYSSKIINAKASLNYSYNIDNQESKFKASVNLYGKFTVINCKNRDIDMNFGYTTALTWSKDKVEKQSLFSFFIFDTLGDNDNNTLYDYVNFKNDINYLDVMDLSLKISKDRRKKGLSQEQDNNQGKTIKL